MDDFQDVIKFINFSQENWIWERCWNLSTIIHTVFNLLVSRNLYCKTMYLPFPNLDHSSLKFIFSLNWFFYPVDGTQMKRLVNAAKRLIDFIPLVSFYSPWKHQKTRRFWCFQGVQKKNSGMKWVQAALCPFLTTPQLRN